jgi:hypothetical protein
MAGTESERTAGITCIVTAEVKAAYHCFISRHRMGLIAGTESGG